MDIQVLREPDAVDLPLPTYASEGAAGLDLCAAVAEPLTLLPGEWKLVSTGIRLALPDGFEAQVRPRSGLAAKYGVGLLNSPGTIDCDYRGVVRVVLMNWGSDAFVIKRGLRIAQLVVAPVTRARLVEVSSLDETERGEGGFGHTGL